MNSIGQQPSKGSFPWKPALLVFVVVGALVAGVLAIRSVRLPRLTRTEFDAAKAIWDSKVPDNYDVTVKVTGMQPGTYEVSVENRVAVAAKFDGRQLNRPRTFGTWSVSGMFSTLSSDLETNDKHNYLMLGAEFDPQYGYPHRYERIEMRTGAHDALQWEVTRFEAR